MGRTIPSFRIVLSQEKQEWKPFRNALDKSERKSYDEMWDIPRLYASVCSNSVQLVPLHPIVISICFHHYKELLECEKQINQLRDNNKSSVIDDLKEDLQNETETEEEEEEDYQQQVELEQLQQLTLFDFEAIRQ